MKLYRFSPIQSEEKLVQAIEYLVRAVEQLSSRVIGRVFPITYLTIFSHFYDEYDQLVQLIQHLGAVSDAQNGQHVKLHHPIQVIGQDITLLRIRSPDPYRMQVGCCDFEVEDYTLFKSTYLLKKPGLRLIQRPEYEMIEFFDPNIDALAYVVSQQF